MDLLGAHVSVAGGPHTAFERGVEIGCRSLQIFVKSPNRWAGSKLKEEQVTAFREAREAAPQPVIAHAAYLINLCGNNPELIEKSRRGLIDELERCARLGVDGLVVHPGAHLGDGEEAGVEGIARSIDVVLAALPEVGTRLLLENTAGQGSAMGRRFEELAGVIERVEQKERVGVCLDTCHAFAAGYDLSTEEGYQRTVEAIEESVGLERIEALHLNDSKHPLGSNKDRHENIGEGQIGAEAFARLLSDPRFAGRPMVVETPLGDDDKGHERDLVRLRELLS
ncbi:MAG TPA: deoxyribonuclease IV [Trueperaceae bacterium]